MFIKLFLVIAIIFSLTINYLYVSQHIFATRIVNIVDGNRNYNLKTKLVNVKDILFENDINITEFDIVFPTLNSEIAADRKIVISRVDERLYTEFISVEKNINRIRTSKLPFNKEIVLKDGNDGLIKRVKKIVKVNNVIVKEDIIEESIYRNKIDKIIIVGTNRSRTYVDNIKSNERQLFLRTTAYTPGFESCAPYNDGITSIGLRAGYGIAAVDPRIIPIGSSLYIPNYGYAFAADIGGLIKEHKIDLCFYSVRVAREFGVRYEDVYILDN
jgi:3D (Asp-Asp-Asp) domain-containing protein